MIHYMAVISDMKPSIFSVWQSR